MYTLYFLLNEIDTQTGTFQTMQNDNTFRASVYGREKIVGRKKFSEFVAFFPTNQSCFSAKPQNLLAPWLGGGGGAQGASHISCLFYYYLTH
jgi:hypothetical protein